MKKIRLVKVMFLAIFVSVSLSSCAKTNVSKEIKEENKIVEKKKDADLDKIDSLKERKIIGWLSADEAVTLKGVITNVPRECSNIKYIPTKYNMKTKEEITFNDAKVGDKYSISKDGKKLVYKEEGNNGNSIVKILNIESGSIEILNGKKLTIDNSVPRWIDEERLITEGSEIKSYNIINTKGAVLSTFKLDMGFAFVGYKDDKIYFKSTVYSSKSPVQKLCSIDLKDKSVKEIFQKENGDFVCYIGEDIYIVNNNFHKPELIRLDKEGKVKTEINLTDQLAYNAEILTLKDGNKLMLIIDKSLMEFDFEKGSFRKVVTSERLLEPIVYNKWLDEVSITAQQWYEPMESSYMVIPENLVKVPKEIKHDETLKKEYDEAVKYLKENYQDKYASFSTGKGDYINGELYFGFGCEKKNSELGDSLYINVKKKSVYKLLVKDRGIDLIKLK